MACGNTILKVILALERPSAWAASTWPRGTALTPARKISASTPAAASATGSVSIQNDGSAILYWGSTKKKK